MKTKKIVIVGDSAFAEIAYEYFEADTEYQVAAFAVESAHLTKNKLFGIPIIAFETLEQSYPPAEYDIFVAIPYTQLNRLRTRLAAEAKARGYTLASYISPRAFIWPNSKIGEHCFIFEDNTIQPFVNIGENVILWSGNHIGHHSIIRNNCFISSHTVVSGFCDIGENSFLGVNSTISNNVVLGKNNWIGPSVTIYKSTQDNMLYNIPKLDASDVSSLRFFKIQE